MEEITSRKNYVNVFEVDENTTAVLNFTTEIKPVHPAIDVVDNVAYVGVFLDTEFQRKKKKKSGEEEVEIIVKPALYFVTSKRKIIPAYVQYELLNRKLRLAYKPIQFEERWSREDIQAFLTGKLNPNPYEVFKEVYNSWKEYLEFPDPLEYIYKSLWSIGTYFHHLFNSYSYIYVGGIKRAGKTKVLTMLKALCFNAFFSMNMSISSIYRLIQNARGTLLIDENEKLKNPERALEFRSLLLSGYKKGAVVYRIEKGRKEKLIPVGFEVYSPKALANIGGLEDVLEDRCKVTIMKRTRNRKIADKEINLNDRRWMKLRGKLYALYLLYWHEVKECYDKLTRLSEHDELVNFLSEHTHIPKKYLKLITARELELWKPIFALAMFFDRYVSEPSELNEQVNLSEYIQEIFHDKSDVISSKFTNSVSSLSSLLSMMVILAIKTAKIRQVENMTETGEIILVKALNDIFEGDGYYKVKNIREKMEEYFDEPQKWLTTAWVGRALRRLGFTEKRRVGTGYEYFITKKAIEDLMERLGIEEDEEKEKNVEDKSEKPLSIISTNIDKHDFSSIKLQLYNFIKSHGPVTLDKVSEFLEERGVHGEEKYKLLDELINERKVKQNENKIGNILFTVSDTPVREEKEEGLSREEKIVLSVFLNLRKAGYEYVQWGDVELECKKYGLDPVTVNKTLRSLKDKGFIGDIVKNGVFYFYLSKTPPKPNLNNILGERSL